MSDIGSRLCIIVFAQGLWSLIDVDIYFYGIEFINEQGRLIHEITASFQQFDTMVKVTMPILMKTKAIERKLTPTMTTVS